MVTMYRKRNWKLMVYGREHGIPHFHLEGPGYHCSVAIASLAVLAGYAPTAALEEACTWARENRRALMAKWQELN